MLPFAFKLFKSAIKSKRQGDNGEVVNIVVQQTSRDNSTCLPQNY